MITRFALTILLAAASAVLSACGPSAPVNAVPAPNSALTSESNANHPTPIPTPIIPKDGDYPGRGKVTKINNELGSIEIDHEEIKDVMTPMKMEFNVSDKELLKNVKVGDQIDFILRYKHPTEIIVKIEKSK